MPLCLDDEGLMSGALLEVAMAELDSALIGELSEPRQEPIYLVELYPYVIGS